MRSAFQRDLDGATTDAQLRGVLEKHRLVKTKGEASSVIRALRRFTRVPSQPEDRYETSVLHSLAALFQDVESRAVIELFATDGTRELSRILRASVPPQEGDHDDAIFLLKILTMYRAEDAIECLLPCAYDETIADEYLWSVIFDQLSDGHPLAQAVLDGLRTPLPGGFARVAYLDFANRCALHGLTAQHPFDTDEGEAILESFLRDTDTGNYSYAHSATASIPFLSPASRLKLLRLAASHPDATVRLEAAWASARLGSETAVAELARAASDPRRGFAAIRYLEELGRGDAIPDECSSPAFIAQAELAEWLRHPLEFGEYPDGLRVVDSRELFWPPTSDKRTLWLIEYAYEEGNGRESRDIGVGMVGSVTFALFGEATSEMSPEDLYGLHCAWELQMNKDPRAPEARTAAAGRKILGI